MARSIILEQQQGRAVVGHAQVHVSIVVDVAEIGGPALFEKDKAAFHGLLGPTAISVVDPQLVDATWVLGVTDELAALGDVEVHISIAVEIGEDGTIVAAVVGVGIIAEVVIHQWHQGLVVHRNTGFVSFPHAAQSIVMTTEGIQYAICLLYTSDAADE